ncbi:hypothetical protein [Virgibacillus kimchii]
MQSILRVGIGLQVIFFILFFGAILPKMNNIFGAVLCLIIALVSLFFGMKSMKEQPILSIVVIPVALLILAFTIFAYFIGEGGMPPLIYM